MDALPNNEHAHLLIVDDEINTSSVLAHAFNLLGYRADSAQCGEDALKLLQNNDYDLMLLDLKMPGIDGVEVMKQVKTINHNLLVIILTAHATLDSAIEAIKAGAVDYLLKPQSIANIREAVQKALSKKFEEKNRQELIEQILSAADRLKSDHTQEMEQDHSLEIPAYQLDIEKRCFIFQNEDCVSPQKAYLTDNEFVILSHLIKNKGEVFSHHKLAVEALGYENINAREAQLLISPHIARLRKKIEQNVSKPEFIKTIRGKGYIFTK